MSGNKMFPWTVLLIQLYLSVRVYRYKLLCLAFITINPWLFYVVHKAFANDFMVMTAMKKERNFFFGRATPKITSVFLEKRWKYKFTYNKFFLNCSNLVAFKIILYSEIECQSI